MSDPDDPTRHDPPTPPEPPAQPTPPTSPTPPTPPSSARKDRLVQTRVPRELEDRIKEEAGRQRLTVSQLVRW